LGDAEQPEAALRRATNDEKTIRFASAAQQRRKKMQLKIVLQLFMILLIYLNISR